MLEYCFKILKLHRVHLTTAIYNIAGQRTYESVGLIREAYLVDYIYRFEKYQDALQYYMTEEIYQHAKKRWYWLQNQ
jgi:RimJ/RimL family protein N-acetyltransferase